MSSRHLPSAAAKKILPALVFLAASGLSPLAAQTPDATAPQEVPAVQSSAPVTDEPLPPFAPPEAVAAPSEPAPNNGAVFDAPNMPGVRMMAPIPDALAPFLAAPRTTTLTPTPASLAPPPPASAAAPASGKQAAAGQTPDRARLVQAFGAAKRGDWSQALRLADQAHSRAAGTIFEWLRLVDAGGDVDFVAVNAFLKSHPGWPRQEALLGNAEKSMPDALAAKQVLEWYGSRAPLTAVGMVRLGEALMDSGQHDKGADLIRKAWIQGSFSQADENQVLKAHSDILSEGNHRARLDQLFARDDTVAAKRQMARVDADSKRVAEARLRLKASPAAVKTVLASLPDELQSHPGLLFDAARIYRQRGQSEDAWAAMSRAPADRSVAFTPDQWWSDRNLVTREALKAGRYDLAYDIASKHAEDSGTGFMEGEFLAGWIALRFVHKPELALGHFKALAKGVTMPISVARAYYWLGRTEEELKHPLQARAQYRRAAINPQTFYGQLGLARIEDNPVLRLQAVSREASRDEELTFESDERVEAIRVLSLVGDRGLVRQFAVRMANEPGNPKRLELLAQLMISLGDPAMGVRVAKLASYNDIMLLSYLAPIVALPRFPGNVTGPEAALVLGIARQESEFDPAAVSIAGARGLMQLMPATAKQAASMHRLTYRVNDLTANPQYNMQLGMATLEDYLEYWGGSYVLAISAYNAGSRNVLKWVEANGDPRDPTVDPIDWIELIPFNETRNYVQRVLENVELYRNRLSGSDQKLKILSDLYRPKLPNAIVLKYQPPPPAEVPIPVPKPTQASIVE